MENSIYLFPLITAFLIALAFLAIFVFSKKNIIKNRLTERHIHKKGISRIGGIAIILAFSAALLLDPNLFISRPLQGVLLASLGIAAIGFWDDIKELSWKNQLFFQVSIVILIYIFGVRVEYVTNPFGGILYLDPENFLLPSLLVVMVWVVVMMNSMNWSDGIDGLSGGITLIGAVTIFLLSLKPEVHQPPMAILAAALAGAVAAFLVFNTYPSRIIAGTSGSMFMGFILAVLAIFAGTKIATTLLVMAVPITDACWVVFERIKSGQSIFEADRRHLHHKLLELGWSQRKICLFFYVITAVIAAVALNTRVIGKTVTVLAVVCIMSGVLYFVNRKINLARRQAF